MEPKRGAKTPEQKQAEKFKLNLNKWEQELIKLAKEHVDLAWRIGDKLLEGWMIYMEIPVSNRPYVWTRSWWTVPTWIY